MAGAWLCAENVLGMGKRKLKLGGKDFMAEEVEFQVGEGGEHWNKYILLDGTEMKVKAVVAEVLRVEGAYAPNGDPLYNINASIIVTTHAPDQLKKKD